MFLARLKEAARDSGRSLAQEVEFRLEQSLERDDVFQGMRPVVYAMTAAFSVAGQYSAGPNVPLEKWPEAARITATAHVVVALAKVLHLHGDALHRLLEAISGQLQTLEISRRVEGSA